VNNVKTAESVCPLCDGTGWKPADHNKVTRCDCRLAARNQQLLSRARIPKRYEGRELANFSTEFDGADSSLSRAFIAAQGFVNEYPLEKTGLLLVGSIGVGKTHLAVAVITELMLHKGVPCLFWDYRELLKEIQNSYNASVQATELEVLRPVFETEVLVLDELGAVRPTEWVWDTVSLILNSRYNKGLTTIITTNYPDRPARGAEEDAPRDLLRAKAANREETLGDRIGERMRSRLHEMCKIVDMRGTDFRQRVQSANYR
jgi:DNA replication protein DnaC